MQNYQMYGQNNYQPDYPQQNFMNLNMMPNQQMPGNFPQAPAQSVSPSNSDENNEAKKIIFNRAPNIDQNGDGVKTSQGFFATYPYANFKDQPEVQNAIFYRLSANVENKDDDALLHAIYFLYFYFLFINSSQREHEKVLSFNKLKGKLSEKVLEELKESEGKSYKVKDIKYYQNLFEKDKKVWTQDFFSDSLNEFFKKQPEKKEQKQSEFEKSYPQSDSLKNMPFILRRDIMILLKHKRNELDGIFTLRKSKQGQQGKRKVIVADVKDEQKFFIVFDMSFELKQGIKDEDFERKASSDPKKEQVPSQTKPQNDPAQNFQQMQQQNQMQPPNNNLSLAQFQGQNAFPGLTNMQPMSMPQYQQNPPDMGIALNMNQPSFPSLSQMQMTPQQLFNHQYQNYMMNQNYQMQNFAQQQAGIPYQAYNFNPQMQNQAQLYQKSQNSQTEANNQPRQDGYGSGAMPDLMGQQLGPNSNNIQQWVQNQQKLYQNSGFQNSNQPQSQPQPSNFNIVQQVAQPQFSIPEQKNSSPYPLQQNIQNSQSAMSQPQFNQNQNMNEKNNYTKAQEQLQEGKNINEQNAVSQASYNPMQAIQPPNQAQNHSAMFPQQHPTSYGQPEANQAPSISPQNILPFQNQFHLQNLQQNPPQQPSQIQNANQNNISPGGSQLNSNPQYSQVQSNQAIISGQNASAIGLGQNMNDYGQGAYQQQMKANYFQGQQPQIMNQGSAFHPLIQNNSALSASNQQNISQNQQPLSILPVGYQNPQINNVQKQEEQKLDANLSYQNQQQQILQQNQKQFQAAKQNIPMYPSSSESPVISGARKQFNQADSLPYVNGQQFSVMASETSAVQKQKISTNDGFVSLTNDGKVQTPGPNYQASDTALNSEKNPVQSYSVSENQTIQQNIQPPTLDTDFKKIPDTNQIQQQNNQVQNENSNKQFYQQNSGGQKLFLNEYNANSIQKQQQYFNQQQNNLQLQQQQLQQQQQKQSSQVPASTGYGQPSFTGQEVSANVSQNNQQIAQFQNQIQPGNQMNYGQLNNVPQQQYNVAQVTIGQMPQGYAPQYQQQQQ